MGLQGGHMSYVVCDQCGDPVAGRIPSGNEERKLECVHCQHRFTFDDAQVRAGIVVYDDVADRWKVQRMDLPQSKRS
jgi:transcription elongation factor Elf1